MFNVIYKHHIQYNRCSMFHINTTSSTIFVGAYMCGQVALISRCIDLTERRSAGFRFWEFYPKEKAKQFDLWLSFFNIHNTSMNYLDKSTYFKPRLRKFAIITYMKVGGEHISRYNVVTVVLYTNILSWRNNLVRPWTCIKTLPKNHFLRPAVWTFIFKTPISTSVSFRFSHRTILDLYFETTSRYDLFEKS